MNSESVSNFPLIKLKDLPDSFTFRDCVIGSKLIDSEYGESYALFHSNNNTDVITFVRVKSYFGKQIKEYLDKIKSVRFNMTVKSFGEGKYRAFSIEKIVKVADLTPKSQTKLEGF